jgi:MoxR-like ATPase
MSTPVTAKLRRGKGVGKSGVSQQGGPCPHECGPTETSPHECGPTGRKRPNKAGAMDRFAGIGAYGFKKVQVALLAALVTEDPLLLIGRAGTGKTYLLNSISEALGLEHRHYNASLIAFDDLVGFPYPDDARESIRFLQTPATVWGAESVLVDEISRCKPEHQNRLFSLVHERRVQGIALEKLRYRWAAMNPAGAEQDGGEYLGSEPLDPALADRFAIVIEVGDWSDLSEAEQRLVANPAGEGSLARDGGRLRADIARWRGEFEARLPQCPLQIVEYARIVTTELGGAGLRLSPRRARLIARSLLAASVIGGGLHEAAFRTVLECSLPQRASGECPPQAKVAAAHRLAWNAALATGKTRWLQDFHLARRFAAKVRLLAESCPDADSGTLAVEQLLANEPPERAAAFALAVYPAALKGALPVGAEGLGDLARRAAPLLHVDGKLEWREPLSQSGTSHPELPRVAAAIAALECPARRARARQLLFWALLNKVAVRDPEALEHEFHEAVEYLAGRAAA